MSVDVLIIDDEKDIRQLVADILSDEGYSTRQAADGNAGILAIRHKKPDLVILDVWLNDSRFDGVQVLDIIQEQQDIIPTIMISGHGTIETAVKTLKKGAYDFLEKPFTADRLLTAVHRALDYTRLRRENRSLRQYPAMVPVLTGSSPAALSLQQALDKTAVTNSRVFLSGPRGAGKSTLARLLHERSHRSQGPFLCFDCALADPATIDGELFGTEPSDLAKASGHVGAFERTNNGTLYLRNVFSLPATTQQKLVKYLHTNTFLREGGGTPIPMKTRIISGDERDPKASIAARFLREDLYYRLAVAKIDVPALSARKEDMVPLVVDLLSDLLPYDRQRPPGAAGDQMGPGGRSVLTPRALAVLTSYPWPANLAELRTAVAWVVLHRPPLPMTSAGGAPTVVPPGATATPGAALGSQMDRETYDGLLPIDVCHLPPFVLATASRSMADIRGGDEDGVIHSAAGGGPRAVEVPLNVAPLNAYCSPTTDRDPGGEGNVSSHVYDIFPQGLMDQDAMSVFDLPLREARELFEKWYLDFQIKRFSGNISKTSAFIGMERSALHRKLKLLNCYKKTV